MDEIYKVGTFTQIHEIQDLGDKLRMVVMGHRRITINGISLDDLSTSANQTESPSVKDSIEEKVLKNGLRRRLKKVISDKSVDLKDQQPVEGEEVKKIDQILMVDTSNVAHHDFQSNQEIKAITNDDNKDGHKIKSS